MCPNSLEDWLGRRVPEAPDTFVPHLLRFGGDEPPSPQCLGVAGAEALARALASPGRNRASAFDLLAGDALLTYACEAQAEEEGDVGEELAAFIRRLGARFP